MPLSYGRGVETLSRTLARIRPTRARGVRVLCFHSVVPRERWSSAPDRMAVTPDAVERAVLDLVATGARVVPFAETVTAPVDESLVALTFDDGAVSFLDHAQPMLGRHGWPATLFVCTDYLDSGHWPDYPSGDRPLRHGDLAGLDTSLVTIASHAHAHVDLTALPADELRAGLARSRAALDQTGLPVDPAVAYPFSAVSPPVRAAAAEAGFSVGVTVLTGRTRRSEPVPGLVEITRVLARGPDDEMALRVSGGYDWVGALRRGLGR